MRSNFARAFLHMYFLQFIFLLCLLGGITVSTVVGDDKHSYKPQGGFVPDAATAIHIAEAVLTPVYGEEKIKSERPFKATLREGVWTVEGSLPEGWLGGVAVVEISKKDGCILRMSHGK